MQTKGRARIVVDEVGFVLAQGQDITDLKHRIEAAVHSGGEFVEFTVVGDDSVSVLVSPSTHVLISLENREVDVGDAGHDAARFGGDFDLL